MGVVRGRVGFVEGGGDKGFGAGWGEGEELGGLGREVDWDERDGGCGGGWRQGGLKGGEDEGADDRVDAFGAGGTGDDADAVGTFCG